MNSSVLEELPGEVENFHEDTLAQAMEYDRENNFSIWDRCCSPPADALKPFKRSGGFGGTDINAQWRMKVMTQIFGTVGSGWGWKLHDRWSEDFVSGKCVFVVCSVWYLKDGKPCWTGEQIGGTEAGRTPDEAYKMAITDSIGKCMSAIGVGADVYLGHCDSKYLRLEAAPQQAYQGPSPQGPQGPQAHPQTVQDERQYPHYRKEEMIGNAYAEPVRQPPAQYPIQQQQLPGDWQFVPIHFGKNKGTKLGALSANSLAWYQENWVPSQHGKNLSGDNLTLYNAFLASMGRLSLGPATTGPVTTGAPKEAIPF